MLKISDFSKLCRISIRMLRYYDDEGILKPVKIEENGYRFYDPKQLFEAEQINYLRYLGFSVDKTKMILETFRGGKEIGKYLELQLQDLKDEKNILEGKIESLTKTMDKLRQLETFQQEGIIMNYKVEVKEFEKHQMMCRRGIIPSYDKEGLLWEGLMSEIHATKMNIKHAKNGLGLAMFYDKGYKEKDVDVEIMAEVVGTYEDTENIKFKEVGGFKVASITYTGGYEHITEVCYQIADWISKNNYEIAGPDFSIYHVGYNETQDPEKFVTEICYPIR